jgi:hypothetical protein
VASPDLRNYPSIFVGGLRKTTINSSNTSQQCYFLSFRLYMYVTSVHGYAYEYKVKDFIKELSVNSSVNSPSYTGGQQCSRSVF